ncbi:MAG: ROK family protein [Bryobacterales bacterium]
MSRRRFLVFETGGTKLVAALADAEGRLLETRILRRNQDDRAEHSLERLIETGRELAKGVDLSGVGFGYGGAVNRAVRRPMICLHEPGWEDLDPVARLEAEFGAPTAIENDCKLAALAEARLGAGKGSDTVFYITIGTGIGGGLVHNGSIVALSPLGRRRSATSWSIRRGRSAIVAIAVASNLCAPVRTCHGCIRAKW